MFEQHFIDRADAGRRLAKDLAAYAGRDDLLVLALPRGGVPVGFEVARALNAPLDVFLVELAMGAIASGGVRVVNRDVLKTLPISESEVDRVAQRELLELERRELAYRAGRSAPTIEGKTVILIDDGLATGSSMLAAVSAIRALAPRRLVVAVPVASPDVCALFRGHADDIVCSITPRHFNAVGSWYDDFTQTTDDEVRDLLARAVSTETGRGGDEKK
jgi:predicted phosphoribosyltransferase